MNRAQLIAALDRDLAGELAFIAGIRTKLVSSPRPRRERATTTPALPEVAAAPEPTPTPTPAPEVRKFVRRPMALRGNPRAAVRDLRRCPECLRPDVERGPVGLKFHYSPAPCELPCSGGEMSRTTAEDRADGVHSIDCRKCGKREAIA